MAKPKKRTKLYHAVVESLIAMGGKRGDNYISIAPSPGSFSVPFIVLSILHKYLGASKIEDIPRLLAEGKKHPGISTTDWEDGIKPALIRLLETTEARDVDCTTS